jgi:hypothetical protein
MNGLSGSKTVQSSSGRGRLKFALWMIFLMLLCGFASVEAVRMHLQRQAIDAIEKNDGNALYASNSYVDEFMFTGMHGELWFGSMWALESESVPTTIPERIRSMILDRIRSVIGREFYDEIRVVELNDQKLTDELLSQLHNLTGLEYLSIYECEPIGTTRYSPLAEITTLKWVTTQQQGYEMAVCGIG